MHPQTSYGTRLATDARPLHARTGWSVHGPLVLAVVLPLVVFLLEGHINFGKADEGFLWYGAQRVLAGDVPLRDFQSYDIGRYYWSAGWMLIAGSKGIVALRLGNAVLVACTVALAVLLVRPVDRARPLMVALAALTFTIWMVPGYKAADSFAAMLLVSGLANMIGDARPRGMLVFGVTLGIAATIGINHALYGVIGGSLGLLHLHLYGGRPLQGRNLVALAGGAALGYAPVLFCMIGAPGFAAAFVDSVRLLFEAGTTNVDVPLPSPFTIFAAASQPTVSALRQSVLGMLFIGAPLFVANCIWRLWRNRPTSHQSLEGALPASRRIRFTPAFGAATLLGIPYAHYAFSSPSIMHVAVSGLPLLVALWTYPAANQRTRTMVLGCAALCSLFLLLNARDGYFALRGRTLEPVTIMGDRLQVLPAIAAEVDLVQRMTEAYPQRAFFAAHDWPGAYAIAGQRAPNWEIYEIFPSRPERQRREIARLAAADPAFVILTSGRVGNYVDGIDHTHPLILDYVRRCFVPLRLAPDPLLTVEVFTAGDDKACGAS